MEQLQLPPEAACVIGTDEAYAETLRFELHGLWRKVIARRAPQLAQQLDTSGSPLPQGRDQVSYLQALNIWFQLLKIVEENAAMRARREAETKRVPPR
tara:strand:+ start:1748 stop:2041 length:294 start_codon:yes stop_codon:yes gene_type:complete